MSLFKIAVDNLIRRKAKAIILAIGLFVAVATMVTLFTVTVSMRENIDAQLDEFGTNLLITPKYKETPLTYGGIVVSNINSQPVKELSMADMSKMRTIEVAGNLNIISPKLVGAVSYKKKTALIVGIQYKNELRIKTWWQYIGKKPKGKQEAVAGSNLVAKRAIAGTNFGKNEVIAGTNFANKFGLTPGSKLQLGKETFTVASILKETGSSDDNVLFMNLNMAQEVLHKKGQISFIEANAYCLDCPLKKIAGQLRTKLPYARVSALKEAMAQKEETLSLFTSFSIVSSIILIIIAIVIILVTMMTSVKERTREIGIFRAIGFRKKHIITIIISEAALVSVVGGLTGYLTGFLISKYLAGIISPQASGFYFNPNNINISLLAISIGSALLLGSLSALYPAIKAARLDPASALRFI
jgi:putative ABC transport system permease protein